MAGSWVWQSVVAMLILSPIWVAIGFVDKNLGVKPPVFLVWYSLVMVATLIFSGTVSLNSLIFPWKTACLLVLVGIAGAVANVLLFGAVAAAPNAGSPVAIGNGASVGSFLLVVLFSHLAPNYFNETKFDAISLLGIFLTVIGISIIAIRK